MSREWQPGDLVVINPGDVDDVSRLLTGYYTAIHGTWFAIRPDDDLVAPMQTALCEFGYPRKPPDEPTGKWAAVKTAAGHEWVRTEEDAEYPWRYVGTGGRLADWNGVCTNLPVTVLHEGKRGAS